MPLTKDLRRKRGLAIPIQLTANTQEYLFLSRVGGFPREEFEAPVRILQPDETRVRPLGHDEGERAPADLLGVE